MDTLKLKKNKNKNMNNNSNNSSYTSTVSFTVAARVAELSCRTVGSIGPPWAPRGCQGQLRHLGGQRVFWQRKGPHRSLRGGCCWRQTTVPRTSGRGRRRVAATVRVASWRISAAPTCGPSLAEWVARVASCGGSSQRRAAGSSQGPAGSLQRPAVTIQRPAVSLQRPVGSPQRPIVW